MEYLNSGLTTLLFLTSFGNFQAVVSVGIVSIVRSLLGLKIIVGGS